MHAVAAGPAVTGRFEAVARRASRPSSCLGGQSRPEKPDAHVHAKQRQTREATTLPGRPGRADHAEAMGHQHRGPCRLWHADGALPNRSWQARSWNDSNPCHETFGSFVSSIAGKAMECEWCCWPGMRQTCRILSRGSWVTWNGERLVDRAGLQSWSVQVPAGPQG